MKQQMKGLDFKLQEMAGRIRELREIEGLTQEQMAQAIGSAREAVTRTLKKLAASGAVELFRGGVKLTDKNDLERRL